jgi:CCR4-NOT transcription complex subunit 9
MQSQQPAQVAQQSQSRESVPEELVLALQDQSKRETALLDLSKKRDSYPDLAPVLWNSFGVIAILLQEIVSIYHLLNPPQLSASQSNRVCNALALLQCVASHPETRSSFISGSSTCFPLSYSLLGLHLTHTSQTLPSMHTSQPTSLSSFTLSSTPCPSNGRSNTSA